MHFTRASDKTTQTQSHTNWSNNTNYGLLAISKKWCKELATANQWSLLKYKDSAGHIVAERANQWSLLKYKDSAGHIVSC